MRGNELEVRGVNWGLSKAPGKFQDPSMLREQGEQAGSKGSELAPQVYGSMHIRLHAYTAPCVYGSMHIRLHADTAPCIYGSMCIWLHAYTAPCIYGSMHIQLHTYMAPCVNGSMHIQLHAYMTLRVYSAHSPQF